MSAEAHHDKATQLRFNDRMLAEAVQAYEASAGPLLGAPSAEAAAREAGGGLEQRVVKRAAALPVAKPLRNALARMRQVGGWAVTVAIVVWALLGAGAARGALEIGPAGQAGEAVNVFGVLAVLLGLQTLLLLVWVLAMLVWPGGAGQGSLGAKVVAAGQWVTGRLHQGDEAMAAIDATGTAVTRSRLGVWLFGGISHAMWLSFNVGCLLMLAGMLSVRAYVFAWETTILTPEAYVWMTGVLGAAPTWLGLTVPTAEQVLATQASDAATLDRDALVAARDAWAGLLLGAVLAYGLAPRLLLLLMCGLFAWRAQRRYRLDMDEPYYQRLRDRLMPSVQALGVIDPAEADSEPATAADALPAHEPTTRAVGPPAIVAVEVRSNEGPWPPTVDGVAWRDLGFVDDRTTRQQVIDELTQSDTEPTALVIVCELAATPDRGTQRYLQALRQAVTRSPVLLLTGGQAVRDRGGAEMVERRLMQWRELARQIGMDDQHVLDLDLDHATDTSLHRLAALLPDVEATASPHAPAARQLEAAFDVIVTHCNQWSAPPDASARMKLHHDIAATYRKNSDPRTWRKLLDLPSDLREQSPADWQTKVRDSAERAVSLLPPSLRLRPRWLAAGAASGALGCVAAATLLSPFVIAALPSWSLIGAAIAGAMQPRASDKSRHATDADNMLQSEDFTEAVDAAAMFAMLLELQGRGEATISRVLDRVLADVDDARRLASADDVRSWLETLRHRFDMALAAEVRP
ncbi:DUF2868 domain-containing protein [Phycisphaerales bacterium AB-hyl4]|uniref:DUF2868 domain-containing protein n=1 Tax=Natronomicrosphaera hydrolytica TaxID=3242702 RepID=A0ABV4U4W7_9BACT